MSRTELLKNKENILNLFPQHQITLQRLERLADKQALPVITVVGKYNHGKSRLLNELIGKDLFSVADIRETKELHFAKQQDLQWIDAPGLDADVDEVDDDYAEEALWVKSDIRLFVHAAKEGELDAIEIDLINKLQNDAQRTQRQTILVLTQTDQVADEDTLNSIRQSLQHQLNHNNFYPVSSVRHRKGVEQNIPLFVEKSGIPELKERIDYAVSKVLHYRAFEQQHYFSTLGTQLAEKHQEHTKRHRELCRQADEVETEFIKDLRVALEQGAEDLYDIMQEPEVDHSLDPGSIDDVFSMSAGKLDRSRIQIAYSRACLLIRSVLSKYGMTQLNEDAQVGAASLNTVMVSVMGVSVKFRPQLRRMFGEEAGRDKLLRDFKTHFDKSENRLNVLADIENELAQLKAVETAQTVLADWQQSA